MPWRRLRRLLVVGQDARLFPRPLSISQILRSVRESHANFRSTFRAFRTSILSTRFEPTWPCKLWTALEAFELLFKIRTTRSPWLQRSWERDRTAQQAWK